MKGTEREMLKNKLQTYGNSDTNEKYEYRYQSTVNQCSVTKNFIIHIGYSDIVAVRRRSKSKRVRLVQTHFHVLKAFNKFSYLFHNSENHRDTLNF